MDWTAARIADQPGQRGDRLTSVLRQVCLANQRRTLPRLLLVLHVAAVRRDSATRAAGIDSALAPHLGVQHAGYAGESDDDPACGALLLHLCLCALSLWAAGVGLCSTRESSLGLLSDYERLHGVVCNRFHHLA